MGTFTQKKKKKEKGATFVQKERENITKYKAKWKPGKPRARNIKKNVTVVLMSYFLRAHSVIIHGHRGNRRHVYGLFCASVHTFPPNRFSTKSINSPESQLERIRGEDNLCVCAWSESGRKCRHRYFIVVVLSSRRNRDLIDTTTRIGEKYEQTTIIFHRERAARKTGS